MLNNHERTAYDERNEEAKKHIGHVIIKVRSKEIPHALKGKCEVEDVICMDCKKQFKVYQWKD